MDYASILWAFPGAQRKPTNVPTHPVVVWKGDRSGQKGGVVSNCEGEGDLEPKQQHKGQRGKERGEPSSKGRTSRASMIRSWERRVNLGDDTVAVCPQSWDSDAVRSWRRNRREMGTGSVWWCGIIRTWLEIQAQNWGHDKEEVKM